ncbi:hypothetical protein [Lentzea sp. NPDC059081]|uniref:2OG-Fe(II)-dependent halogenase WelO5 family protein n=1 Tax=Lentzea sp. NPDC059081 TaxID=3346719 RepID=UPI0036CBC319
MNWDIVTVRELDRGLVGALFDNEVAAIRIPGFLSREGLAAAVAGIEENGLDHYRDVDPPIGKIGITQFEHRHGTAAKAAYFEQAAKSNLRRQEVFARSGDPVELVSSALAAVWPRPVSVAEEPAVGGYFAGLVRMIREGLVHCDWAPHDAPGWSIGEIDAQITWNVYLQLPQDGGATYVYDRPWDESAEEHAIPDSYGYDDGLVADRARVRIEPAAGDLTFFNSRNFHAIERSSGSDRISVSSFVGRHRDGRLVLWS